MEKYTQIPITPELTDHPDNTVQTTQKNNRSLKPCPIVPPNLENRKRKITPNMQRQKIEINKVKKSGRIKKRDSDQKQ
jgi:hypothetical protein